MDSVLAVFMLTLLAINGVKGSHKVFPELQSLIAADVDRNLRTGYHFQPPKNWINDPNAPMYVNGLYHLFYQYNPKGAVWGNIVWAHSVSKDLINWQSLPTAISPSKWFDINGCWSGSATVLPGGKPVIMYTGVDHNNRQVQVYAVPKNLSDPYLREWIKPETHNPFVDPDPVVNASAFRDPTTAWFVDGHWKLTVGSRRENRGVAYLYRSRDFITWRRSQHPLHSKEGTGMWECPDFYPVSLRSKEGLDTSELGSHVKHAFKVSLDVTRYDYYTLGRYDTRRDRYYPDPDMVDGWAGLRYDYGNFYASKSFYDPVNKRRILWGWANESDWVNKPVNDMIKGWAGIQLIPRAVWLDRSGMQLVQWPIEELETLRSGKIEMNRLKLPKGGYTEVRGITSSQADVEVVFSFASLEKAETLEGKWNNENVHQLCSEKGAKAGGGLGPFGVLTLASIMHEEYTPVFFRVYKGGKGYKVLMCSDAITSSLAQNLYKPTFGGLADVELADKKLSLRSLIDNSVVESFGAEGKVVITSRVYPTVAINEDAHLYVFNNGEETVTVDHLRAWSMRSPAKMNTPLEE